LGIAVVGSIAAVSLCGSASAADVPLMQSACKDGTLEPFRRVVGAVPGKTRLSETPTGSYGPRHRPFMALLAAVPMVTHAGQTTSQDSETFGPRDRFVVAQLVAVGYVVNPRFRFGLMGIFNEALTGLPPRADRWQFGGVAPVAIGTPGRFVIGGGPIFGYRAGGKYQANVGAVIVSGVSIPVRKGLSLNIVTPVSAQFTHRVTLSVGVAVGMAKVFINDTTTLNVPQQLPLPQP
jgi:hypothetical protein